MFPKEEINVELGYQAFAPKIIVINITKFDASNDTQIYSDHVQFYNLMKTNKFELIDDDNIISVKLDIDKQMQREWNWINDPQPPQNETDIWTVSSPDGYKIITPTDT